VRAVRHDLALTLLLTGLLNVSSPLEKHDLATQEPERVSQMLARLQVIRLLVRNYNLK
jgi:hypothetical protein